MIKGILLGVCVAVFVACLVFIVAGAGGLLQENIITGQVIGSRQVVGYALVGLALSFVGGLFIAISFIKRN